VILKECEFFKHKNMIAIIDYGAGNVGSIQNMIKKIGYKAIITSSIDEILNADHLILPGVGSFDYGMSQLEKLKLIDVLEKKVVECKTPILGICLGMQLMAKSSEEGIKEGLNLIDAEVVKFKSNTHNIKIPHMGWNYVNIRKESKLFERKEEKERFYFVHSFHVKVKNEMDILATTDYGCNFTSAIERENIYGVQFHPEKSHRYGMQLLEHFIRL